MKNNNYGEVKTKKNIFPKEAREIAEKGTVGILISQCTTSDKTKKILDEANITLYEGVEPTEVEVLLEKLRELELKEKTESEKGE